MKVELSGEADRSPIYIVLSTSQVMGYGLAADGDETPFGYPVEPPALPEEPPLEEPVPLD